MSTSPPRLGRCKDCDYTIFVADPSTVIDVDNFNEIKSDGRAYRVGSAYLVGNNGYFARCPQRHRFFPLKQIKGTYSPDHKCDSRCLNARGHNCTCSCGGANHGRGYTVAHVVEAKTTSEMGYESASSAAYPKRAYDPSHIGEVGKYIKGTATIATIYHGVGPYSNTIFAFHTDKGDTIKWFAPESHAKDFQRGQTVTFRAKVKAHETHERFGKSTIVTYLEEVTA